jgi:triosephosphate isomerase (TIM)
MKRERKLIIAGKLEDAQNRRRGARPRARFKNRTAKIEEVDIVVFPPFTALSEVTKAIHGSNIHLGA